MQDKAFAVLAATSLGLAFPAHAQQGAPESSTLEKTGDMVTEPFDGKEIPAKLMAVQDDPYSLAGLGKCAAIIREVEELNAVLGPDVNERAEKDDGDKTEATVGRVAGSVAGSFIPFGGVIGEITGANDERRRYAAALYAGTVRRGFLKGVGLERGCKAPARP
ncbi:hypothetical protein KNJ79_01280 [Sphingopyxis indica]|uniref:hypothetical protein n=1 Tax=Sphingopyxis indica TaxID=436663 RepID=UPI002938F16C|nr:hypothetical protein [Sphingopyxis indica]WOF43628.1 hypothetical protein KNJ79_01280 [Sphingopyxis indica]